MHRERYAVDPRTGCWVWQFRINPSTGYGHMTVERKSWYAHRWYYEQAKGLIPDGLEIDHLCRNRACVNPAHLEAVTPSVNMQRAWDARGRPWPDALILATLHEWSAEHDGRGPTRNEWAAEGRSPSAVTIKRRFGTWNGALEAAGLPTRGRGGSDRRKAA